MTKTVYESNTIKVRVTVYDENADGTLGSAKDLSSATMAAYFGKLGGPGVTGTVTAVDLPNGVVDISFPANTAEYPTGTAQLEVTISGNKQTVYSEAFNVKRSVEVG